MASNKQLADLARLQKIADNITLALVEMDGLARHLKEEHKVLRYLLTQAHGRADEACRTEHVAVHGQLPNNEQEEQS